MMKTVVRVLALVVVTVSLCAQERTIADVDPLLAKIAAFQHGQSREPLGQFTELVFDSMRSPDELRQIEARLLKFLESGPTPAGRDFAFDQLTFIATDASVPLLSSMLQRSETAEQARFLLERIPGAAASEALRKGLDTTAANTKIGIINSLGRRRDALSVPVLVALVSDRDQGITEAALAALAGIAVPAAAKALASARTKLEGVLREEASEAYAECADQLAKRGDRSGATRMYRDLIDPREAAAVRIRALAGLVQLEGKNAMPAITAAIQSKDRGEQAAAITFLDRIPGAEITKTMVAEFPKLAAPGQVRILAALAERGDAAAKPLALAALKSNSGDVRAAGYAALGELGDESSVIPLAEAAAERAGPEQDAARQSLWSLGGPKIDAVMVEAIASHRGKIRTELIAAAGERGIMSAAAELASAIRHADADVQRAALRALRNVGGSEQVPAVLDFLLKAPSASERREATQTLAAVLKRSEPQAISVALAAYDTAASIESRVALLEVMGQTSNEAALPVLRKNLTDANPAIVRAAILALTNWETPAALTELQAVAKDSKDPVLSVLALRGYIKLIGLRSARPVSATVRLLSDALQMAKDPAEKRSVLALLPIYPTQESLQLAEGLINDEAVSNEAKAAVNRLRNAMRQQ